jgi:hypothetical protein
LQRGRGLAHGIQITSPSGQLTRGTETLLSPLLCFDARGGFEGLASRQ